MRRGWRRVVKYHKEWWAATHSHSACFDCSNRDACTRTNTNAASAIVDWKQKMHTRRLWTWSTMFHSSTAAAEYKRATNSIATHRLQLPLLLPVEQGVSRWPGSGLHGVHFQSPTLGTTSFLPILVIATLVVVAMASAAASVAIAVGIGITVARLPMEHGTRSLSCSCHLPILPCGRLQHGMMEETCGLPTRELWTRDASLLVMLFGIAVDVALVL